MKEQAALGDERQKIINDMIVGARTIKSYGWENHFINKVSAVRIQQQAKLIRMGVLG